MQHDLTSRAADCHSYVGVLQTLSSFSLTTIFQSWMFGCNFLPSFVVCIRGFCLLVLRCFVCLIFWGFVFLFYSFFLFSLFRDFFPFFICSFHFQGFYLFFFRFLLLTTFLHSFFVSFLLFSHLCHLLSFSFYLLVVCCFFYFTFFFSRFASCSLFSFHFFFFVHPIFSFFLFSYFFSFFCPFFFLSSSICSSFISLSIFFILKPTSNSVRMISTGCELTSTKMHQRKREILEKVRAPRPTVNDLIVIRPLITCSRSGNLRCLWPTKCNEQCHKRTERTLCWWKSLM